MLALEQGQQQAATCTTHFFAFICLLLLQIKPLPFLQRSLGHTNVFKQRNATGEVVQPMV